MLLFIYLFCSQHLYKLPLCILHHSIPTQRADTKHNFEKQKQCQFIWQKNKYYIPRWYRIWHFKSKINYLEGPLSFLPDLGIDSTCDLEWSAILRMFFIRMNLQFLNVRFCDHQFIFQRVISVSLSQFNQQHVANVTHFICAYVVWIMLLQQDHLTDFWA